MACALRTLQRAVHPPSTGQGEVASRTAHAVQVRCVCPIEDEDSSQGNKTQRLPEAGRIRDVRTHSRRHRREDAGPLSRRSSILPAHSRPCNRHRSCIRDETEIGDQKPVTVAHSTHRATNPTDVEGSDPDRHRKIPIRQMARMGSDTRM